MLIKNLTGHLKTILHHRHLVMIHCFKAGIIRHGLTHDLSKFSPSEFIPGVLYFQGHRSPNERERELKGYSKTWMHHKGRNRHHFEYWNDYNTATRRLEPVEMPNDYIIEMFCDRLAASKTYNGKNYTDSSPLEYYMRGKNTRFIAKGTAKKLEFLLRMLAEKGEDYTFRYIRNKFLKR